VYPRGLVALQPTDVAPYLGTTTAGSNDLNRLVRHEAFWRAWLAKVAQTGAAVPGESGKGLARFVPALAKAQTDIKTLPVTTIPTPDNSGQLYLPVDGEVKALVSRLIPFPVEAVPGGRPKVRILDGTGRLDHGVAAAPALVSAGGQITAVGNAANFDYKTTQVIYYDDAQQAAATQLRDALGVGEVVKSSQPTHDVDMIVILGTDYAAKPVAQRGTVVTTPPEIIGTVPITQGGN